MFHLNRRSVDGELSRRPFRECAHPDCATEGSYRAPRSRGELTEYYWFCLDHVRTYNAAWDFFEGMSQVEIDAFRCADVTGHRPTWPMGPRRPFRHGWNGEGMRDLFELFGAGSEPGSDGDQRRAPPLPAGECDALATMNLTRTATFADIKNRFKELVKRHHPDANGGDKAGEERLKGVIAAYRLLVRRRYR